jgi:hypothetical protein
VFGGSVDCFKRSSLIDEEGIASDASNTICMMFALTMVLGDAVYV